MYYLLIYLAIGYSIIHYIENKIEKDGVFSESTIWSKIMGVLLWPVLVIGCLLLTIYNYLGGN